MNVEAYHNVNNKNNKTSNSIYKLNCNNSVNNKKKSNSIDYYNIALCGGTLDKKLSL